MIAAWAAERGIELKGVPVFENSPFLPGVEEIEALIVLGGPMGVYDEADCPWLKPEKLLIRAVIDAGKPVLGICLGAQLIADVLGADVKRNPMKEIGWFPIQLTDQARAECVFADFPQELTVLHWHGDTFDLPKGAVRIGHSDCCVNQGFLWGENVIALQFHLEAGPDEILKLAEGCAEELDDPAPTIHSLEQMVTAAEDVETREWLWKVLDGWGETMNP